MQAADFRNEEAIHIVYILCGSHREDEFLTSLKSLHLFAVTALQEEPAYYHVHIISNQQVRDASHTCHACTTWTDSYLCRLTHLLLYRTTLLRYPAHQAWEAPCASSRWCKQVGGGAQAFVHLQWGMNESAMLKPRSNFRMTLHMATPDAPDMFAACAMQARHPACGADATCPVSLPCMHARYVNQLRVAKMALVQSAMCACTVCQADASCDTGLPWT